MPWLSWKGILLFKLSSVDRKVSTTVIGILPQMLWWEQCAFCNYWQKIIYFQSRLFFLTSKFWNWHLTFTENLLRPIYNKVSTKYIQCFNILSPMMVLVPSDLFSQEAGDCTNTIAKFKNSLHENCIIDMNLALTCRSELLVLVLYNRGLYIMALWCCVPLNEAL
jgi:hypothetical protein